MKKLDKKADYMDEVDRKFLEEQGLIGLSWCVVIIITFVFFSREIGYIFLFGFIFNIIIWRIINSNIKMGYLIRKYMIKKMNKKLEYIDYHITNSNPKYYNYFFYELFLGESKSIKINEIFENFNILIERLNLKKKNKYKDNKIMLYDFISNLNDCCMYLNNSLIMLRMSEKDITYTPLIFGISKKSDDGRDGVANNIKNYLDWIEKKIEIQDIEQFQEIKNYFLVCQNIIRNFYSHGWLKIFPFITLSIANKEKDLCYLYLTYEIEESSKELVLNLNIHKHSVLYDEIKKMQLELKNNEKLRYLEEKPYDSIKITQELSRPLLRMLSTDKRFNDLQYKDYPYQIIIFSENDKLKNIIICEEMFFNKINELIIILEKIID